MAFDNFKKYIHDKKKKAKNLDTDIGNTLQSHLKFLKIHDSKKSIKKRIKNKANQITETGNILKLIKDLDLK